MAQQPQPARPTWKTWHKATLAAVGAAAVLALVIAIIAALATDDTTAEPEPDRGIPASFADYRADIDAIDPGILAGRQDQPVFNDANNTCADIQSGTEDDVLLDRTVARFGVNDAAAIVTEDIAQQILDATREHCDTIRPA